MPPEKYRIIVLLPLLLWSLRLHAHLNHNSIYPLTANISKEIRVWQFLEKNLYLLLSSFYQASPSSDLLELQSLLIFCPSIACFASYSTTHVFYSFGLRQGCISHTLQSNSRTENLCQCTYSHKKKEHKLLSDLIKCKAPCNLLIFGAQPQYMKLSMVSNQVASQSF